MGGRVEIQHGTRPLEALPMVVAAVHRTLAAGDPIHVSVRRGAPCLDRATAIVAAGGFEVTDARAGRDERDRTVLTIEAVALRALADHIGPGMRLLCCGLNPSLHAADAGVGYVTGSNRFWPAMAAAGLATEPLRDPFHLLEHDHVGMTDLVKRATPRADELTRDEYRVGVERLGALCSWLHPGTLAVVGLAGWRAAVDRKAAIGWQPEPLGGTPVYVLPSTSGLNARVSLADLTNHLRAAAAGPGSATA